MNLLKEYFEEMNIPCSDDKLQQFMKYRELVLEYNQKLNLTSINDPDEFLVKHFIDSVVIYDMEEYADARKIMDLGTGAGFPGVPLAILSPDKQFVLADSLEKRIRVVTEMVREIGLRNVTCVHGRAEELGRDKNHREKYDLCVSRAVADLSVLSEYCLPFVKEGGAFIAYKGPDVDEEVEAAMTAVEELGGAVDTIEEVEVGDMSRSLVVIYKESKTPSKYPRNPGKPKKNPIR